MTLASRRSLFLATLAAYVLWLGALAALAAYSAKAPRDRPAAGAE